MNLGSIQQYSAAAWQSHDSKTFPKSFISTLLKFLLQEPPSATTFFKRLSSSAQPEIVSLPLSPLTPGSIIFVALLRCLVLFRSCFCCWQGSKIKLFPVLRAETGCASGVVVSWQPEGSFGKKQWIGGSAQMLDPMPDTLVIKWLWLPFSPWTVFNMEKQLWQKGGNTPWIIPGTQAKCGREEIVWNRTSPCLIVFNQPQGNLS